MVARGGVFVDQMDGILDVWDYYYKQNDLTLSCRSTTASSRSTYKSRASTWRRPGRRLALPARSARARTMQNNEKVAVPQMLDRESQRENLAVRAKELRQKEKK